MAIKKKQMEYQPHGEVNRVISLDEGRWAYVINEKGKLQHLRTDSNLFIDTCAKADIALDGWIERDLRRLGWDNLADKVLERKPAFTDDE